MVKCVRVPKKDANSVRIRMKLDNILDPYYEIRAEQDNILIPLIGSYYENYDIVEADLKVLKREETDYKALLPVDVRNLLPSSYDKIGDAAIIRLVDKLLPLKYEIGRALMETSSNVRCVFLDSGIVGNFRVRNLEMIAGKGPSEIQYKEFGVIMNTDLTKVYCNPRLATERRRVASLVKDDEVIIDMFAGIASFPLIICKHARPKTVYAIDLNHTAVEYAKKNVVANHFNNVVVLEGDARVLVKNLPLADRIIMNLPQIAHSFLPDALERTKSGGTIHMYKVMDRSRSEEFCSGIVSEMTKKGLHCELSELRELKTYSSSASIYVLDIVKC
ncbi:MAG: class I SAM-dependent methyltransferase family protein [archaeon]|nr:class I SAM-dependent methyltransferase family protein [archaeon]